MLFQTLLYTAAIPAALGCGLHTRQADNSKNIQFGSDAPSDPATTGFFMNHLSLNVDNVTRSIEFYSQNFGFRHLFTYNLSPHVSFTYMSHSQGGRNGSSYQTVEEMIRQKNNNAGHLEFVHLDIEKEAIPGSPERVSTINHIGIIVPDLEATQARLEANGVCIYKKIGAPMPTEGYLSSKYDFGDATNLSDEEFAAVQAIMTQFNSQTIFASDPDGNLLEILPLNEPDLFG
jgi:lactoylglutathione lyase